MFTFTIQLSPQLSAQVDALLNILGGPEPDLGPLLAAIEASKARTARLAEALAAAKS